MIERSRTNRLEIKSWYDHIYWSEGAHYRPYDTYLPIIEYLKAQPGAKLLDVGCGGGRLLMVAQERGLGAFGVDLSSSGAELARSFAPKAYIVVSNGERLPFPDNSFDYLTCLGSLEYFLDIEAGVREITRVCKAGAGVCITWKKRESNVFFKDITSGYPLNTYGNCI